MLFAEEQPVAPLVAPGAALVEKAAEGGDAGAGADHDQRDVALVRQAEVARGLDMDLGGGLAQAVSEKGGRHALAPAVAHRRDGEMYLAGMGQGAGSDGIEPRLQALETAEQLAGIVAGGKAGQHIGQLPAPEPALEFVAVAQQGAAIVTAAALGDQRQGLGVGAGDLVVLAQGLTQ